MKTHLETMELAAVRIAADAELPQETARNLNALLKSLVHVLNRHTHEIERLSVAVKTLGERK